MTSETAGTAAARVRAAQAWADLSDDQLAAALGVSKRTLSRLKTGAEVSLERRLAIAEATGVPAWFMASGFEDATAPGDPDLAERVEAIEAKLQTALGLARTRDQRVATLEDQMEAVLEIAIGRVGADLGDAAARQGAGEGRTDAPGRDRSGPRPGVEGR